MQFVTTSKRSFFLFFSCRKYRKASTIVEPTNALKKCFFDVKSTGESKRGILQGRQNVTRNPSIQGTLPFSQEIGREFSLYVEWRIYQVIRNVVAKNCKKPTITIGLTGGEAVCARRCTDRRDRFQKLIPPKLPPFVCSETAKMELTPANVCIINYTVTL